MKVLYKLKSGGFEGYLVGGGVRDLLLGREPKDFDVVTDAHPEQIKALFRNCHLIGRRFRLAHVRFGPEIIEVATFRSSSDEADESERLTVNGRILRDNAYGTLEEDAIRRDFTVNCLYYNIQDFSVIDFSGGMRDLQSGLLRLIGDPQTRFREDPVRLLRAVRFAAKLGFRIEPGTEGPMRELAKLLEEMPPARLFDEALKIFLSGHAVASFELLDRYGLFERLFPATARAMNADGGETVRQLVLRALTNTDQRVAEGKSVTPAFLFAALLWGPMIQRAQVLHDGGDMGEVQALDAAAGDVIEAQVRRVAFPKRFSLVAREIWSIQPRLEQRRGRRPLHLLGHPRFRAAYDFLLLRGEAGEGVGDLPAWWTSFQEANPGAREALLAEAGVHAQADAPRKRRRRRRSARAS